jgi:hypothetical protein
VNEYHDSRTKPEQQASRKYNLLGEPMDRNGNIGRITLEDLAEMGRRHRQLEEAAKKQEAEQLKERIAQRTRGEDRPVSRQRVRLDKEELESYRAEDEARAWRKANVDETYVHSDLLWTPPVRPRRKGRVVREDAKLLSPFEWDIALAVISMARPAWRQALHNEAMRKGAASIEGEARTRERYFDQLSRYRAEHGIMMDKPNIGKEIKQVGKWGYRDSRRSILNDLKKSRRVFRKTVVVETSAWALLKDAKLGVGGKSVAEVDGAIERLKKPVVVLRSNAEKDFDALLKSARREGSKLILEVNTHWFAMRAGKVTRPLPRKNPTALALYLFSIVAQDDESEGIHIANLCKRLHLDLRDKWLKRTLDTGLEALNEHLTKVGLPNIKMEIVKENHVRISRV